MVQLSLFANLSQKANRLVRHDLALANPCWLFPVPHFSFMYPKTHSKRACSMIFPRSAVELRSPGFRRSPFWQMGAVFASHCCGFPVLSVTFQRWENSLEKVSVSFLSILGCSPSGSRDLHGSGTPAAVLLPEHRFKSPSWKRLKQRRYWTLQPSLHYSSHVTKSLTPFSTGTTFLLFTLLLLTKS